MPKATDLSLKNAAAVIKTFALAAPAAGTSPAVWFLREGANQSAFASLEISSRKSGGGSNARRVQISLVVPIVGVNASGATVRIGQMPIKVDAVVPDSIPDTTRDDAIAYVGSALADALVKASIKTGYAPT